MNEINELNAKYENAKKILETMQSYEELVFNEQNSPVEVETKIVKSLKHVEDLTKVLDCTDCPQIIDTLNIVTKYRRCVDAIAEYRSTMLSFVNTGKGSIDQAKKTVVTTQKDYDTQRSDFEEKYHCIIDSVDTLNNAIAVCIGNSIVPVRREIENIMEFARHDIGNRFPIDLSLENRPNIVITDLPERIVIARQMVKSTKVSLLKDIGMEGAYQIIHANLKTHGNTLIRTKYENLSNDRIDRFILAYIIRFIESFPIGSTNIHIFGQNISFLYKRLCNSFQTENSGELARKTIQIHTDVNDLLTFRDVICEDIFQKTSVDKPDLYSIYENDKTDPFNLIVIRDGLVDGSGYVQANILDIINSLSKQGNTGHKCGLRFLIIDSSPSFDKNYTDNVKYLISQIYNNCEHIFDYNDNNRFYLNEKEVEVLDISGDIDAFIQNKSNSIAEAMNNKEQTYITIKDVASRKVEDDPGSIMSIPVGISGETIVELPFSCNDEKGTVAGQCIGYMVIGQSGAGKSSFFHSLILNGCIKYSPKNLQFWLLDFKNGGASSKYRDSGLPHIKIIAENNKIDDALCLFQMVLEEMERRSKLFNDSKIKVNDIVEYNKIADSRGLKHLPRIIIAIDEVQEIFRDDNSSEIQNLISQISTRMRSAGMHFVMVAQNLSEGKSYMLKDAFLPSATGRVCFRVAPDIPRDSGFDEDFSARKQEIAELKTGEAYVGYGHDTIKKVRMAYTSAHEMSEIYFPGIRRKYPSYEKYRPKVIGSKKRLSVVSHIQGSNFIYFDLIEESKSSNGIYYAVIGEDAYRMQPLKIKFSQHQNSSILLLGDDKQIASSLCTSIALSLFRQGVKVHLFNGDRTEIQMDNKSYAHSFMYICQNTSSFGKIVSSYRLNELKDVTKDIYREFLSRQSAVQEADYENPIFKPIFMIINDLTAIGCFRNNERLNNENSANDKLDINKPLTFGFFDSTSESRGSNSNFSESIQSVMSTLLNDGWRYNIFLILSIRGDASIWRSLQPAKNVNSTLLFNRTEYVDQFDRSFYLKEMLRNIANETDSETLAVFIHRNTFSKVRPIIYDISIEQEKKALEVLEGVSRG